MEGEVRVKVVKKHFLETRKNSMFVRWWRRFSREGSPWHTDVKVVWGIHCWYNALEDVRGDGLQGLGKGFAKSPLMTGGRWGDGTNAGRWVDLIGFAGGSLLLTTAFSWRSEIKVTSWEWARARKCWKFEEKDWRILLRLGRGARREMWDHWGRPRNIWDCESISTARYVSPAKFSC